MQTASMLSHQLQSQELISVQSSDDNSTSYHCHSFLELAYVIGGSAVQYFNSRSVIVREGDYFMINYGEAHKYSPNGDSPFTVVNVLFKPEFLDPSLKDCRGFQDLVAFSGIGCNYFNLLASPTSVIFHDDTGEVRGLVQKMALEYHAHLPKGNELLRAYLTELLILTLRKIYKRSDSVDCDNRILCAILDHVNQHYREPITLRGIAEQMGYTQSYLSTLFAKHIGLPFNRYLQNLRIGVACRLLSDTDEGIEAVAAACGYRDVKFFRTVFRDRLKLTPTEFRQVSRKKSSI